jgi:peptide/nickel transport system substrate-binding protein
MSDRPIAIRARFRGVPLALIAVLAGATAVTACSGQSSAHGTAAARGVLTIASGDATTTLDPGKAAIDASDAVYEELAYEPLINLANGGQFLPGLATSWSYVGSGNEEFVMTIRSGAKFSDGTPVTAAAVAASINYWRNANGPVVAYASAIKSVKATGPSTVEVDCAQSDPNLPIVFSRYIGAGDIISPAGLAHPSALQNRTFGAGPYMLAPSQTVTGSTYTYVPNPYFYDQSAIHWSKVVVKVISNDNAALSALQTGEVNVAQVGADTVAGAGSSLKLYTAPAQFEGLYLVNRDPGSPLAKLQVRQALNYAVDRDAIAKAIFGKFADPSDESAVPGWDGWDPSYMSYYTYNPGEAKKLLAEAGYAKGFTLTVDSLNQFEMSTVAQAIAGYLSKVGVTLDITATTTVGQYVTDALSKKYDVVSMFYGGLPMYVQYQTIFAKNAGVFNPFATQSSLFDSLAAKAAALPGSQGVAGFQQLQQAVVNQAWNLGVLYADETWLTTSNISGFSVGPGNVNPDPDAIGPAS